MDAQIPPQTEITVSRPEHYEPTRKLFELSGELLKDMRIIHKNHEQFEEKNKEKEKLLHDVLSQQKNIATSLETVQKSLAADDIAIKHNCDNINTLQQLCIVMADHQQKVDEIVTKLNETVTQNQTSTNAEIEKLREAFNVHTENLTALKKEFQKIRSQPINSNTKPDLESLASDDIAIKNNCDNINALEKLCILIGDNQQTLNETVTKLNETVTQNQTSTNAEIEELRETFNLHTENLTALTEDLTALKEEFQKIRSQPINSHTKFDLGLLDRRTRILEHQIPFLKWFNSGITLALLCCCLWLYAHKSP